MKPKVYLYSIVFVVLIALLVLIWVNNHRGTGAPKPAANRNAATSSSSKPGPPPPDNAALPMGIPPDLPIEPGATVTQNHDMAATPNGARQSDRTYISKKSIQDNLAAYQKYFKDNKYKVLTTLDKPDYKALTASGGPGTLNVIFNYQTSNYAHTVSIYFTPPSAAAK